MKRFLSLLLTLTLIFVFFGADQTKVEASVASTCTTNRTVFVHYHRWDDTYTDTTIWTWNYGTNGSGDGGGVVGTDDFGAIYQICVDDDASEWDDTLQASQTETVRLGLIMKYSAAWGDGFNDRDAVDTDMNGSKDGNHKLISVRENDDWVGFDAQGIKHVYVFEGSNQVIYADDSNSLPYSDTLATIAVIYYDPAESYEGWNMWTWSTGTNGTNPDLPNAGDGIPFVSKLGIDGGEVENYRVGFINVDPTDMGDTIGLIVRTAAWEKKFDGDILISTEGLEAGDFKTVFYIAGESDVLDTFEEFDAQVNLFEIEMVTALDPNSIEVVFNKDVVTKEDDVDTFNANAFMVKDVNGNEVAVTKVSYNSVTAVNKTFTLITEEALTGEGSPYKVYYMPGGSTLLTKQFEVDNVAPVITIIGNTNVELELGDSYSLPTFSASDMVGDESVAVYNVRIKEGHGTVDTRNAGVYEIVIEAHDKFGNVAEEVITVTVTDPCDTTEDLDANAGFSNYIALIVGLPLVAGAFITLRRSI